MKKLVRFVGLIALLCAITTMSSNSFAQSASCAECGRTHAQIMSSGHAPSCKYYVAPKTSPSKSSSSSGSSSVNATNALIQGALDIINENTAEKEEAEKREAELAAQREAMAKEKRIAEEKAKNEKLNNSYKPLGSSYGENKAVNGNKGFTPVNFNCKITTHKGMISIRKANGETHVLGENESLDIHEGDVITTGENGHIKIHFAFEKGGDDICIDSNTKVRIVKGEDGIMQPEVLGGNFHSASSILDYTKETLENLKRDVKTALIKKLQVRTPTAIIANRGTDFTVSVNDLLETEVIVFEGSVDIKGIGNESSTIIEAGFRGRVSISGSVAQPEKINLDSIKKWWTED